jgi:EpsI family protein
VNLERAALFVLVPTLIAFGAFSWLVQLRDPLAVDTHALAAIPLELEEWRGQDVAMESGVEEMLDADFNLQRAYWHPVGDLVWLYVGYYGTERGGRPEHTPWACYPSNGWTIVRYDVVDAVDLPGHPLVRANELLVEKGGDRVLVHFWYQNHRKSGMLGGLDQALEHFVSRIRHGRADGSLVRLSTPIRAGEDDASARLRLRSLSRALASPLERHWPNEARRPAVGAGPRAALRP